MFVYLGFSEVDGGNLESKKAGFTGIQSTILKRRVMHLLSGIAYGLWASISREMQVTPKGKA